jgi:hypothetical protein
MKASGGLARICVRLARPGRWVGRIRSAVSRSPQKKSLCYVVDALARSQKLTRMNNRPRRLLAYPLARHLEILVRGLLVEQRFPKPLQPILPCTL